MPGPSGVAGPGPGLAFFPAAPQGQSQDGVVRDGGAVSFIGVGVLSATAIKIKTASAVTFIGVGLLSATPTVVKPGSAAFVGKGTLSATPSVIHSGTAAFVGKGTLSATPTKIGGAQQTGWGWRKREPRPYVLHVTFTQPTLVESKAPERMAVLPVIEPKPPYVQAVAMRVPDEPRPVASATMSVPLAPRSGVVGRAALSVPDEPEPILSIHHVTTPESAGVEDAELVAILRAAGLLEE